MPLGQFSRLLADESGYSVIVADQVDGAMVSGEFSEMAVDDIVRAVARRLNISSRVSGKTIFLGDAKPEDRGQFVRRVRRLEPDQITAAVAMFASEGKSIVESDGLVVVADRVEALEGLASAFDAIEAEDSAVWIVQLHLVGWSRQAAEQFGVNVTPSAAFSANLVAGSAANGNSGLHFNAVASLDAVLKLANSRDDVAVVAAPMLVLLDGGEAAFVQGDKIPVPTKTVSDQGTVNTTGFKDIQTGVEIKVKIRERTQSAAKLTLDVHMSELKRLVEESAPVTGNQQLTTQLVVEAGGVYLAGSLSTERQTNGASIGWQTGDYKTVDMQVVQVWCEAFRVCGPLAVIEGQRSGGASASPAVLNGTTEKREEGARVGGAGGELGETGVSVSPWSPPAEVPVDAAGWQGAKEINGIEKSAIDKSK